MRALLLALLLTACAARPGPEFPLPLADISRITLIHPDGRAMPVRVTHPPCAGASHLSLVVFSHGANSSPEKYDALAQRWATRYAVAAPAHADPPGNEPQRSWELRMADMALLLASVPHIEAATGCRIRAAPVAAAGHSYGALVAQALGGARLAFEPASRRDPRVAAVVALSPPGPIPGYIEPAGWSGVEVPMYVQTGTADVLPVIAPAWDAHLASWDAARSPGLLFVGADVDHYFGNLIGRPERDPPSAAVAQAFEITGESSRAFLDYHLRRDPSGAGLLAPDTMRVRFPDAIARYEVR